MKRVLIVEDRESAGVGCGFLAATLRSLGYEVTEAQVEEPSSVPPPWEGIHLMVQKQGPDGGGDPP